jgi:hypothetical protein
MNFLRVLSVLCGLLVHAYALDREAFTFTNYNLEVRIEPEQRRLAVRGKVTLRNDSASPQKNLSLQISSTLDWRSIQIDGKPVQFVSQPYTSDIDHSGALSEALVSLPKEVPPKAGIELEVGYEGTIPIDATRLTRIGVPAEVARHSDWDQIGKSFTAVRGIGYVAWYPIATEAANLSEGNSVFETVARWKAREVEAQLRIKLSHSGEGTPASLICNGEAGGLRIDERMDRAYGSVNECVFQPLGQTAPLFVIGKYEGLDRPSINISYIPDHKAAAETYALAAQTAIPFVTGWFGTPRGRAEVKAEVIELSDPGAAPYESGSMLLTPLNGDSKMAQMTAVHQITHAGFYSPRPWMYEGLAHFAQAAYRERESGRAAALDFMGLHRTAVAEAEKAVAEAGRQNTGATDSHNTDSHNTDSSHTDSSHTDSYNTDSNNRDSLVNTSIEEFYRSKAMYVWWMLRDMIGESALKQALAAYRPEADDAPAYIQHLIEAQSKRGLQWFFDDWVYRDRGLADFRVAAAYSRKMSGSNYIVTVTVENRGDAGAEVPVTLKMVEGQVVKKLEVRSKSQTVIRFEAASAPLEVVVNDGSVPESDMSNNVYTIEIPEKTN